MYIYIYIYIFMDRYSALPCVRVGWALPPPYGRCRAGGKVLRFSVGRSPDFNGQRLELGRSTARASTAGVPMFQPSTIEFPVTPSDSKWSPLRRCGYMVGGGRFP